MGPQQPIKINDPDEGHLKRRALLNKHLSKNKIQISPMRKQRFAISTFSIISLWDSNSNNAFSPLHILSYSMTWGFSHGIQLFYPFRIKFMKLAAHTHMNNLSIINLVLS